jgi:adenosylcobinamide-GDP ribazoletransferase
MNRLRGEAALFGLAWQFLTRLPAPGRVGYSPERMAAAMRYFPAVGAAVGLIGAAVLLAAAIVLPTTPAVLLATTAVVAATGGLHEDGLADTFDGLGAGERALEAMRDSRIGTWGVLALVLVLALKVGALAAMPTAVAAAALVAGHAVSRLSMVVVVATSRYVRPDGAGTFTMGGIDAAGFAVAAAAGLACLVGLAVVAGGGAALAGLLGVAVGHLLSRGLYEPRLGGYTGDCLGATQQLGEAGLYLGVVAWL